MKHKLCLVVCENLKKEVLACLNSLDNTSVKVISIPANCVQQNFNWSDIRETIKSVLDNGFKIEIILGSCFQGLEILLQEFRTCNINRSKHCLYLFYNRKTIDNYIQQGAYVITPGWLGRWRDNMNLWGLNNKLAKEFFKEVANKLLLLDTEVSTVSINKLKSFQNFTGLPYEVVPVGLDYFKMYIQNLLLKWKMESNMEKLNEEISYTRKQAADYAMMFEVINDLSYIQDEENIISAIIQLVKDLFAPGQVTYIPYPIGIEENFSSAMIDLNSGFTLEFQHSQKSLGLLMVNNVAFPEFIEHYRHLAALITQVASLAIANARRAKRLEVF